eukprot:TRINITY_DN9326_c0_g1_i1.p1 TRINITY_DN9326_c0_g1~~TRINITY_DN9326_c0_g1_i1.p1  ORF type:complete len:142 (+),score=41.94 TRINITY_DN9326_c0_g1_i1:54-428(+)
MAAQVRKEVVKEGSGPQVTKGKKYSAEVTLYIEDLSSGKLTPSGWSTRADNDQPLGNPFQFSPGVNLIEGWTQGALQMKVGERARIHVPPSLGYGSQTMGSPKGPWYIPANSNLCFDLEITNVV